MRVAMASLGARMAAEAPGMSADELFELNGDLQGVVNAAEGAQLVVTAHAAAHETRLTDRGPVEVHHGLGFVDAMAPSEVSLATGVGQWAAGRRVSLAAALAERFPRMLGRVVGGDLGCAVVQKVVSACDGLDEEACAAVEAVLVDRLPDLDPSRVTTVARRVATRVAGDQVRAAQRRHRRDRCVQVSPGPDGTTTWWAQVPAAASAAAWSAITSLGATYAEEDPSLTIDQARADAFVDLLLSGVEVSAKVTIGLPVVTGPEGERLRAEVLDDDRDVAVGGGSEDSFSVSAALSGCELPGKGIGWVDADTVIGAAVHRSARGGPGPARRPHRHPGRDDERRHTGPRRRSATSSPPATGPAAMWGCDRPRHEPDDLDHARPWPSRADVGRPTSPACASSAPPAQATPTVELPPRTRRHGHCSVLAPMIVAAAPRAPRKVHGVLSCTSEANRKEIRRNRKSCRHAETRQRRYCQQSPPIVIL